MRTDGRAQVREEAEAVDGGGSECGHGHAHRRGQGTRDCHRPATTVAVVPLWDRCRAEVRG